MPATKNRGTTGTTPTQDRKIQASVCDNLASILPSRPRAGVCLHITSLPGRYGIGEIGQQAFAFIDVLREMQLSVWQFLPTGPTAFGDSPYQPLSTFAGNELLIDIGDLVARGLVKEREAAALESLPVDHVDYGRLIPLKTKLLKTAARRFEIVADASLRSGYDEFVDRHNSAWLHDYALFRILKTRHLERAWPEWQPKYAHRDPGALQQLESESADLIESIKVTQFLFRNQWQSLRDYARDRGILMFGDMPIYVALDSADVWADRQLLTLDEAGRPPAVAGVPPDYFSSEGQLWGNPLYDWDRHAAMGYRWWIDRMAASAELADLVRVDHFRGFEAYWSVPANAETASTGLWQTGPGDAVFDAMRNALGRLPIVAENLGVITPEVEALRERHGIPGMYVLQFNVTYPDYDLARFDPYSVCYTGTHDNDTTLGWFRGSPGDRRSPGIIAEHQRLAIEATGGTAETISEDMVRLAWSSPSRLAIAPMQDLLGLGSEARLNRPGSAGDNWRWRLGESQLDPGLTERTAGMTVDLGRGVFDG